MLGDSAPTGTLGDYGVQTSANSCWAEVSSFGRFAVGVPPAAETTEDTTEDDTTDDTQDETTEEEQVAAGETTEPPPPLCGLGVAPLSAMGLVNWLLMISGLVAIRRGCRPR